AVAVDGPDGRSGGADAVDVRDLAPVWRPGRLELVGRDVLGDLRQGPAGEVQLPDVVAAFDGSLAIGRVGERAVGGEDDLLAVRRDARLALVTVPGRQLRYARTVRLHGPDVEGAALVSLEGDEITRGRPVRPRRLQQRIGERDRRAAVRRQAVQRPVQIEDQRALVGRQRSGGVGHLPHGDRRLLQGGSGGDGGACREDSEDDDPGAAVRARSGFFVSLHVWEI